MTQTNPLTTNCKGLNLDIEPKVTISPKGIAKTNVMPNISSVVRKPIPKFLSNATNIIISYKVRLVDHGKAGECAINDLIKRRNYSAK